jgi:predicted RNA-binding Zn ribbon-like protein
MRSKDMSVASMDARLPIGTRTKRHSDWRDGFLFLGNQLALDFLNTRPVDSSTPTELLPDFPALARWFRAAGLLSRPEAARFQKKWQNSKQARAVVKALRVFRDKLREQVLRWSRGGVLDRAAIAELNRLMAAHPIHTQLLVSGNIYRARMSFHPNVPEDLFVPILQSIAELLATANRDRVRKCNRCVLLFQDTSKKGTRRWCSMQLCGNRFKVAAYAARKRQH